MTRLIKDGLSRRQLLKGASALGGAALILPASYRSARAEPKKGGVMRIAIAAGATSDGYDPGLWDQQFVQVFATARHNYLTEIGADGQLVGELAESWESDDAMTWRLKLRQGITFHSGKPVTVDDAIASINYHRGDNSTSAAKPIVEAITDIKADGDWLVFTLNAANADFPFILSDYHLPVMPSADGKIDPTSSGRLRSLQGRQLRARRLGGDVEEPELLEDRPRASRWRRTDHDHRLGGAAERASDRRGRRHRPGRQGHRRPDGAVRQRPHHLGRGHPALRVPDGQPRRSVHRQSRPDGAEVRGRPAGTGSTRS